MLCNGKSGRCNKPVEPRRLSDREHYECKDCGEKWDTDLPTETMTLVIRRPLHVPLVGFIFKTAH
jgi:hypothetical protein